MIVFTEATEEFGVFDDWKFYSETLNLKKTKPIGNMLEDYKKFSLVPLCKSNV